MNDVKAESRHVFFTVDAGSYARAATGQWHRALCCGHYRRNVSHPDRRTRVTFRPKDSSIRPVVTASSNAIWSRRLQTTIDISLRNDCEQVIAAMCKGILKVRMVARENIELSAILLLWARYEGRVDTSGRTYLTFVYALLLLPFDRERSSWTDQWGTIGANK
jgi:hypothetical protein